jgi:hypothetical protein
MDYRGECWASNENLADELDVKPRSVRNYIAAARERGLLDVVMTDRGRVFRATIPSSNVVPIRRGDRNPDAGGWQSVATKAGKPVEPKGETGSLQSPVSTDKPNTSGLETPEASRPPEESSPRNVTQDLSDELGGSTRLVTKTSDPETWQRLNAEAEAEALRKIAEHRRRFGADS